MKIKLLAKTALLLCYSVIGLATVGSLSIMANANEQQASSITNNTLPAEATAQCASFLQHSMRKLHSEERVDLCLLTAGKTVLMINTASNCGFTPQFKSLEALHQKYQSQGLVVIGFPSDDFFQEEDDEKDTAKVCFVNYGVTFTMLETSAVKGSDANKIFTHLAEKTTAPKWNFYKYLVSNNGETVQHFNSKVTPTDAEFIGAIEQALVAK